VPELVNVASRLLLVHRGELVDQIDTAACDENGLAARMNDLK
jgi:hypothetical protein